VYTLHGEARAGYDRQGANPMESTPQHRDSDDIAVEVVTAAGLEQVLYLFAQNVAYASHFEFCAWPVRPPAPHVEARIQQPVFGPPYIITIKERKRAN
jgi:hypothetical protein